MDFYIVTLFPEALESYISSSIIGRAQKSGRIRIHVINPRDFTDDTHKTADPSRPAPASPNRGERTEVDDRPFGGGPGMVIRAEPVLRAVESVLAKLGSLASKSRIIIFSPSGKQFVQAMARTWAKRHPALILICGRYEGVDERVRKILKAEEVSIGPYVLTGGELPALAILDVTARHIPGVLGKTESLEEHHGSYPVYTRPEVLEWKHKKHAVPKILLSGDHAKIAAWRKRNTKNSP
ncbi:MAG: tRNA (guanine(37)-N(1))-methyltransferase [Candidatus Niyogibacteria bacterium]|nr:tRNA (guanine(37)-N(1))-methyltransferase [Candidatus Niyogibacteria bacterium]